MTALEANFKGVQHVGIPVTDMDRSRAFYAGLGFEPVMSQPFEHNGGEGLCSMMQRGPVVLELFRMPPAELEEIRRRGNGHIDHVAFGVEDVDLAFAELKQAGYTIDEQAPVLLDFWEDGCRFFNVIGPDGERLEFNEILKPFRKSARE